jgi:type IV pilus assembly protein PilY1
LRRVLTFTGDELPEGEPFESLGQDVHEVSVLNPELTATMLGLPVTASASDRATLIDWVRGRDVDNEDRDASGDTSDERYSFGDPLHSSPTVVTYGGTREQPVDKLFVGANDGALRMIDAATGEEEWAFFPPETLLKQAALRANAHGAHIYGMDLTPTAWVQDTDSNGVIDAGKGDFVRVIAGMRRGGNAYYGLDVTPSSPLTRPGEIAPTYPRLMWRIQGGTTAFPRLGQTGSRPVVTPLRVGTDTAGETDVRELLVFAGGYDAGQDDGFGPGGLGNALYLADPATGERLFWISGTAHASGDGVLVPDLAYPIPSDLTLLDADGDEVTDRLYVGDTGGQLWRIDLFPQDGVDGGLRVVVGKLLSASSDSDASDHRKFFYPPDVVQVADPRYAETSRYDLVILTSGDREHPVGTTVEDRAYALRDYWIGPLADAGDSQGGAAGDGLADGYEAIQGPLADLPGGDLFDATDTVSFEDEADLTELRAGRGWYLTLEGEGEKGLSSPVTLKGKLFFTTYLPTQSSDACYPAEGAGRLYGVDVLTARPIFNWGTAQAPGTKAARVYLLRSGVPSAAIPFVSKEGIRVLVGAGPGVSSIDPLIPLPWQRSYWVQED